MICPSCGYEEASRNDEQNRKFHAQMKDLAAQVSWHGQKLPAGVWKRLVTAAWLREEGERPIMVPALDGIGVDVIFERTSKLSVKRMASLITWVDAFSAEHGVIPTDPNFVSMMREYAS